MRLGPGRIVGFGGGPDSLGLGWVVDAGAVRSGAVQAVARRVVKVVGWAVRGSSDWTEMARAGLSERSRHGSGLARRGGERRGSARIVQWGGLVRTGRGSGSRRAGGWVGRGRASRRWRGRARRGREPDWQVGEMWACDERGLACRTARGVWHVTAWPVGRGEGLGGHGKSARCWTGSSRVWKSRKGWDRIGTSPWAWVGGGAGGLARRTGVTRCRAGLSGTDRRTQGCGTARRRWRGAGKAWDGLSPRSGSSWPEDDWVRHVGPGTRRPGDRIGASSRPDAGWARSGRGRGLASRTGRPRSASGTDGRHGEDRAVRGRGD